MLIPRVKEPITYSSPRTFSLTKEAMPHGCGLLVMAYSLIAFSLPAVLVPTVFGLTFLFDRLNLVENEETQVAISFGAGLLIWVIVAFFQVRAQRRSEQMHQKFGRGVLRLNKPFFTLGDELHLEYERQLSEPFEETGWAFGHLVCAEIVRTERGTDYIYTTKVLWQHALEPVRLFAGQRQHKGHWRVTLPEGLPVSYAAHKHWIVWHLQFREEIGRHFDEEDDFNIPVFASAPLDEDSEARGSVQG